MTSPKGADASPMRPSRRRAITSTIGASGGDDVATETDIVRTTARETCMDYWVSSRLIGWATGENDQKTKDKLKEELDAFAARLAGPKPSPVETVLAETAALNWFALRLAEAQYAG